jgi:hypothetical protein
VVRLYKAAWRAVPTPPYDRWHQKGRRGIVVDRRSPAPTRMIHEELLCAAGGC